MPTCPDGQTTVLGVCPSNGSIDIDCVPETSGLPAYTPAPDQIPFAYDPATLTLWVHVCPNSWTPLELGLCGLPVIDLSPIVNPCTAVSFPVTVDNGAGCVTGTVSLDNMSNEIIDCATNIPSTVVQGSSNVTVTSVISGTVTTYTITVDPDNSVIGQVVTTGNVIATHDDGDGLITDIIETVTTITSDGAGGVIYTSENGATTNITAAQLGVNSTVTQVATGHEIATHDDGLGNVTSIQETVTSVVSDGTGGINYISEDGTIFNVGGTVIGSNSIMTQVNLAGNQIATHDNGLGATTPIFETVTSIGPDGNGGITYIDEDGTSITVPMQACALPAVDRADAQTLVACDGAGNAVRVPVYKDGNNITVDNVTGEIHALGGYNPCSIPLVNRADPQTLVACDGAGGDVRLPVYKEGANITIDDATGVISAAAGNTSSVTQLVTSTFFFHPIAIHDDGNGNTTQINETVTDFFMDSTGQWTYINEAGTVQGGFTPRGIVVWREGSQGPVGAGSHSSSSYNFILVNDPSGIFTTNATGGITVNQDGRYLIANQSGNPAAVGNIGETCIPLIYVNGVADAGLPGGFTPYPQNHTYIADVGIFGTTHLITYLDAGDVIRGGATVTGAGQWGLTEGYVVYLGA